MYLLPAIFPLRRFSQRPPPSVHAFPHPEVLPASCLGASHRFLRDPVQERKPLLPPLPFQSASTAPVAGPCQTQPPVPNATILLS